VGERKLTPDEQAKRKETHSAFSSRTIKFKTLLPDIDGPILKLLDDLHRPRREGRVREETRWLSYLSTLFPLFLLIGFFCS